MAPPPYLTLPLYSTLSSILYSSGQHTFLRYPEQVIHFHTFVPMHMLFSVLGLPFPLSLPTSCTNRNFFFKFSYHSLSEAFPDFLPQSRENTPCLAVSFCLLYHSCSTIKIFSLKVTYVMLILK
jgi:hypothetical protein